MMHDDFSSPVLGIDLGASFTKVAYRSGWQSSNDFEEPCRLVLIEGQSLIPSLVIKRMDETEPWLFGQTAAIYRPTEGDRVFANWKADLFRSDLTAKVTGSLKAAGEFFRWLLPRIIDCGIDVRQTRVKLCLPAFPNIDEPTSILGQELELAGWNNVSFSRIEEPRANVVGVFSEGRNRLHRSANGDINPVFMWMYPLGSPLLEHLRSFVLIGGQQRMDIGIIDIGSFTTDVSIVEFDAHAEGDYIRATHQTSHDLGIIRAFEEPLLNFLSERHNFESANLTFDEREDLKRRFANSEVFAFTVDRHRVIRLGDPKDQEITAKIANDFASQIVTLFKSTPRSHSVKYLVLTGGGSEAKLIREAVITLFARAQVICMEVEGIEPTESTSEPRTISGRPYFKDTDGIWKVGGGPKPTETTTINGPLRCWTDTDSSLARLATALGAGSVILDLVGKPSGEMLPTRIEPPWVQCSCQGGNKNCIRCGGQGMYLRREIVA